MTEEKCFISDVRQASREVVRELGLLKSKHEQLEVSYSQGHTLLEIEKHTMLTVGELARILQLDKSTMSRIVYGLIRQQWLEYSKHLPDRRQKPIVFTDEGKKKVELINLFANKQVAQALSLLSLEEKEIVARGLTLYAKALATARKRQQFKIREIKKQDNATMAGIVHRVLGEFHFSGAGTAAADPELENLYEAYSSKKAAYFVVVEKDRILGGAGVGPLRGGEEEICELQKMYLLPEARGIGLGESLLNQCLEAATIKGYKKCYLETANSMEKARKLYYKLGFRPLKKPLGKTGHFCTDCWYIKNM